MAVNRISQIEMVLEGEGRGEEFETLETVGGGALSAPARSRFERGDRVRVSCGTFVGAEGTVAELCGANRLVVALQLVQSGVSLEIDERFLELQ